MKIEGVALSSEEREATLYLREWRHMVFGSLRRPAIYGYIKEIGVRTIEIQARLLRLRSVTCARNYGIFLLRPPTNICPTEAIAGFL